MQTNLGLSFAGLLALLAQAPGPAQAASHAEAPMLTLDPVPEPPKASDPGAKAKTVETGAPSGGAAGTSAGGRVVNNTIYGGG